jgi:hypothetical protein
MESEHWWNDSTITEQEGDESDPVFADMSMLDLDERRQFMRVCRRSFAQNNRGGKHIDLSSLESKRLEFNEWKIYVSLLLEMKCLDVSSDDSFCYDILNYHPINKRFITDNGSWDYSTTERSDRIFALHLSPFHSFGLPLCILRLGHLRELYLRSVDVVYLPLNFLMYVQNLETLCLQGDGSYENGTVHLNMEVAKYLRLKHLFIGSFLSFEILHRCTSLESLGFYFCKQSEIDRYLDIICTSDCCFAETLHGLSFLHGDYQMKGHHLEALLLQAVPRFSNLKRLDFYGIPSNILNIKVVADRIRSDTLCNSPNKSLESVGFYNISPLTVEELEQVNKDSDMKAAVLTVLETFNTICKLVFPTGIKYHSDWEYAIVKNMAGRRFLEDSYDGNGEDGSSSLTLSVWPIVLQRLQQRVRRFGTSESKTKSANATGIYYLLREGPALIGRKDLIGNRDECRPQSPKRRRQE